MIQSTAEFDSIAPGHRPQRVRDRLLPLLSVAVAGLLALGTWQVAVRVREYNSNRAVGGLIVAGMMAGKTKSGPYSTSPGNTGTFDPDTQPQREPGSERVNLRTGLPWLSFPEMPTSSPAEQGGPMPALPVAQLTRATSYAEVVVYVWERISYGVAGVLGLVGLVGLISRRVRGPHLFAAIVLLLGTAATLVGMRLLVDPDGGAFHPLPLQSYLIAGLAQSVYALILLGAFAREHR
jgi:hypothetical protein